MTDIFREVDEDLRRQRLKDAWDKYGIYFLVLAAVIVIGVAGWRGYEYYQNQQAQKNGDRFVAAMALLEDGKNAEAAAAFEAMVADSSGRYPTLAAMAAAGAKAAAGEGEGAIAIFDKVAGDGSAPQDLRSIARIRAAYLLVDTADRVELERRVGDLAAEGSVYRAVAQEILGLAAYRDGDLPAAKKQFEAIAGSGDIPRGLQQRVAVMLQLIAARSTPSAAAPSAADKAPTGNDKAAPSDQPATSPAPAN